MGKLSLIGFVLYLIAGLYFINSSFNFITMPEFIQSADKWILLVGGILIILGGINYLRAGKNKFAY